MKKFLYFSLLAISLILSTLLTSSCHKIDANKPQWPLAHSPHTLMFYFVGNSLDWAFEDNIRAAQNALCRLSESGQPLAGNTSKPRILYFHHKNGNREEGEIIELIYNGGQCIEKSWGTYSMPLVVTQNDMSYYLSEMIGIAPADSYGLVIGSHSIGWVPIDASGLEARASAERWQQELEYWKKAPAALPTRFLGEGHHPNFPSIAEGVSNMFDIDDLATILSSTNIQFEYTIYDACMMANVESLYDLRYTSKYIIASVCEIMGNGFPYESVTPCLLSDKGTQFDLDGACQAFNKHYAKDGYSGSVSLIDCSELEALANITKDIIAASEANTALPDIDDSTDSGNAPELQTYEGLNPHLYYDFGQYINYLCKDAALKEKFDAQLNRTVVSKYTLNKFYSGLGWGGYYKIDPEVYSGLSTSLPSSKYRTEYIQTAWYKATH